MISSTSTVPISLLKTRSTPTDAYESYFSHAQISPPLKFSPTFIPVLEHRFRRESLQQISNLIRSGVLAGHDNVAQTYGGLIFTSQRAVEAFTCVVNELRADAAVGPDVDALLPSSLPLYVVGPATARGLRAIELRCQVLGEETGNGEALARFILERYNGMWGEKKGKKPPLLFLVGEQRRDIIPNTLHTSQDRINVDELVVYETGEMVSFRNDFVQVLRQNRDAGHEFGWVVVFSPTGCKAMLSCLGLLDEETGRLNPDANRTTKQGGIFVATIGPTTRDYLLNEFGFEPDVCAEKPSPEGIGEGIDAFMEKLKKLG